MGEKKPQNPQDLLKKIEQESTEEKKQTTIDILSRQNKQPSITPFQKVTSFFTMKKQSVIKLWRVGEFRKSVGISFFMIFVTLMSWQIESRFDKMRKKVTKSKTFKEEMIQQQNKKIVGYLSKNAFQPVPIQDEIQPKKSYKFEQAENIMIDTRDDLLYQIARQYRDGESISPEHQKELRERNMI